MIVLPVARITGSLWTHTSNGSSTSEIFFHSLTGKRDCLGRSLALSQFFLFFAALMQRYSFKSIHENLDMVDTAPVVMFTQTPKPFQVILNKKSEYKL